MKIFLLPIERSTAIEAELILQNGDRLLTGEASVRNRLGRQVTSVQKAMQWGM